VTPPRAKAGFALTEGGENFSKVYSL